MIVAPIPIGLTLALVCMVPIDVGVMTLFPIHVIGAVFVAVPLVIVAVIPVVISLIVMVIVITMVVVILGHQSNWREQGRRQREACQHSFHNRLQGSPTYTIRPQYQC